MCQHSRVPGAPPHGERAAVACGFTLVELLVVITIIGILVSLLLPAVNGARENARSLQCKNNLKQINLAGEQHCVKYGYYPTSGWGYMWTGDPDMGFDSFKQPGGWMYSLLPFMELESLHQMGAGMDSAGKRAALAKQREVVVSSFYCPTRRRAAALPFCEGAVNADNPAVLSKTDYAANAGTVHRVGNMVLQSNCASVFPNCPWLRCGSGASSCGWDDALVSVMAWRKQFDGISGEMTEVRPAHILDGASNTIFAAEKYLAPDYYISGNACVDNNSPYQGNDWDLNRWVPGVDANGNVTAGDQRKPMQDTPGFENCTLRFGSAHPTGMNVAMCDGSIRTLPYSIDLKVYSYLGNRKDRKPIPPLP